MLQEPGHGLSHDVAVGICGHLGSDEGFHVLVVVELANNILELDHEVGGQMKVHELLGNLLEELQLPELIRVEGGRLSE